MPRCTSTLYRTHATCLYFPRVLPAACTARRCTARARCLSCEAGGSAASPRQCLGCPVPVLQPGGEQCSTGPVCLHSGCRCSHFILYRQRNEGGLVSFWLQVTCRGGGTNVVPDWGYWGTDESMIHSYHSGVKALPREVVARRACGCLCCLSVCTCPCMCVSPSLILVVTGVEKTAVGRCHTWRKLLQVLIYLTGQGASTRPCLGSLRVSRVESSGITYSVTHAHRS